MFEADTYHCEVSMRGFCQIKSFHYITFSP